MQSANADVETTCMIRAILVVGLLSSCATQTKVVPPLPEALPDATGPAIIYSVGSMFEIDRDPYYDDVKSDALESFDGYLKIIDSAEVFNIKDAQSYIDAVNGSFGEPEAFAMCFEPRHAIKYPSIYGEVTAQICFECGQAYISIDGWGKQKYFVSNPNKHLDAIYDKYNVRKPVGK